MVPKKKKGLDSQKSLHADAAQVLSCSQLISVSFRLVLRRQSSWWTWRGPEASCSAAHFLEAWELMLVDNMALKLKP